MVDVVIDERTDTILLDSGVLRSTAGTFVFGSPDKEYRALVRNSEDQLVINFSGDFPGGVRIRDIADFSFRPGYKLEGVARISGQEDVGLELDGLTSMRGSRMQFEGVSTIRGSAPPSLVIVLPDPSDPIDPTDPTIPTGPRDPLTESGWKERLTFRGDVQIERFAPDPLATDPARTTSLQALLNDLQNEIAGLKARIEVLEERVGSP
jgi:hypothetical protein